MDSNLSFFNLPFGDSDNGDLSAIAKNDFPTPLPPGSLLEADDILDQFLSAEGPLESPNLSGPSSLHCEICQKKFDNAKKYYGHLRVHSKDAAWSCDLCANQNFSTKQQLLKHRATHNPERVWKCPECPIAFGSLRKLQEHINIKHEKEKAHKCDKCDKTFHKVSDLKKHQNVHSETRRHACSECPAKFTDKSNLKRHMATHTRETRYRCIGCKRWFHQLASQKRHIARCPRYLSYHGGASEPTTRQHYCGTCGLSFPYKNALTDHCVRLHPSTKEKDKDNNDKTTNNIEASYETIVDEILSVEDDYSINHANNQPEILANVEPKNLIQSEPKTNDSLMNIEFLKDINQLHTLDDELFYNDIDFDSLNLNTSQVFNRSDIDYGTHERNEILFDFAECGRSIDQDLMNALYQVRAEQLPDELLNVSNPVTDDTQSNTESITANNVLVNECATIFESDVDLEASTNLAMNLNQLIGENSVHYVSTEDDDTFIISLDSAIDAEKLTDLLNIGFELAPDVDQEEDTKNIDISNIDATKQDPVSKEPAVDSIVLKLADIATNHATEGKPTKENKVIQPKVKEKKQVLYVCRTCKKVFKKKDNWRSHIATHDPGLCRHRCRVCHLRFPYRSTLTRHTRRAHTPAVLSALTCGQCARQYRQPWMLRQHMERDHERLMPFKCEEPKCEKSFYKEHDLKIHKRYHTGSRPYTCDVCARAFVHVSHLRRHERTVDCTRLAARRKSHEQGKAQEPRTREGTRATNTGRHKSHEHGKAQDPRTREGTRATNTGRHKSHEHGKAQEPRTREGTRATNTGRHKSHEHGKAQEPRTREGTRATNTGRHKSHEHGKAQEPRTREGTRATNTGRHKSYEHRKAQEP